MTSRFSGCCPCVPPCAPVSPPTLPVAASNAGISLSFPVDAPADTFIAIVGLPSVRMRIVPGQGAIATISAGFVSSSDMAMFMGVRVTAADGTTVIAPNQTSSLYFIASASVTACSYTIPFKGLAPGQYTFSLECGYNSGGLASSYNIWSPGIVVQPAYVSSGLSPSPI